MDDYNLFMIELGVVHGVMGINNVIVWEMAAREAGVRVGKKKARRKAKQQRVCWGPFLLNHGNTAFVVVSDKS